MSFNQRPATLAASIFFSVAAISLQAYTLPDLPAMPLVVPAPANTLPMGDPASFPETNMDFAIETNGPFQPTWNSIAGNVPGNGMPAWLRQAKFGIWFHYGPQANLASGDWSAQHMYQPGSTAYNNHLANFGHPTTNGYKDVINAWSPTNYSPAGMAQLFYNAGARFVLVQGVHHDNFDNWNSKYNPWNTMNFGAKRDTMAEWTNAIHNLGMHLGVAFHHEYSWWFTQPDFLSDTSGTYAGVAYDAVTATNSAGQWWQNYDTRRLYNQDIHKYQGISTPTTGYWNPTQGIFTNDLDYCHWYATQWALRMLDVVENYDPDFIYTDGNSTQPFSGYATGTGYKCDAMERVIAHYYNRTLERHGKLDTLAVVKFHGGDHIGTTFEGGYSTTIKDDQPWFAEFGIGDWFWKPGISYDSGGAIVWRLLEAISRDGAMMVNIPNRPDGALDSGATNMLAGVGQWMNIHSEGIYGSRAWVKPTDGSFRFTVGTNGCLYAFYEGIPSAGTPLVIPSLATTSNLLVGSVGSVSLLGSASTLVWSQTATGLVVTCPATLPTLPSGTAIGFKIGPASAVGSAIPTSVIALPGTNQISVSWFYPSATATCNVKRSTTPGGSYTNIATGVTNTFFVDTNVSAGTLYFYVVSGVDAAGQSANSAEASASPAAAPSGNWLTEDVGAVGATGSFGLTNSVFTLQGSGADIWYSADEFRYVFQAMNGDGSITARVLNLQSTANWAKAGVMIRETLDAASKYVVHYLSPANGVALQQRASTGGSAAGVSNPTGVAAPYWLRLVRAGDTFTAYDSPDGMTWSVVGTTMVNMNAVVYAGLEVCSVNDGTLCQAQFDNVVLTATNRPAAPGSLLAVAGDRQVTLSWNTIYGATGYNVKRSPAGNGAYSTVATNVANHTFTDANLTNGTTYYYVVSAINAGGEGTNSAAVGAMPAGNLSLLLLHRYRFNETSGTNCADSVGGAGWSGTLQGGAQFNGQGQVTLTGVSGTYVKLPGNLLAGLTNVTIEAWVTNAASPDNVALFSFDDGLQDGVGGGYLRFVLHDSGNARNFLELASSSGSPKLACSQGLGGQTVHVACVYNPAAGVMAIYTNGVLEVSQASSVPLSAVSTNLAALGRSPWSGDPWLAGSLDEFRIYNGALTASQIAAAQALGPDQLPATVGPSVPAGLTAAAGSARVVLAWSAASNATGYNVKRAPFSGGAYAVVAQNVTNLTFTDPGLANGTMYYYVVSGTNNLGESANSAEASARPTSPTAPQISPTVSRGQLQFSWPADHTGWTLQAQTNSPGGGLGTNWVPVADSSGTNQMYIPINPANGSVFFRLVYP
jgi:alpha-L-fucosidase